MAPKPVLPPVFNPMPTLWTGIREDIDKLEARQASQSEWDKLAAEKLRITSVAKLLEMVPQPLSKSEAEEITERFHTSALTVHYGFDSNFHALVFFDSELRARKVIKW